MQSYYLNRAHDLTCALQELSINAVVTGARIRKDGVTIQIEASERYEDGQVINNCTILFKQGENHGN